MAYDIQPAAVQYETVATFPDYPEAQAVVDRLSDKGFDVSTVKIVGEGLRSEEFVTGRLTTGRAALAGAGTGAWLGLLLGVLFGIFAPGFGWVATILWAVGIGAVWGAIFGAIAQESYALALLLFRNLHRALSRTYILETVWGNEPNLNSRSLDMHVSRIRNKLELRPEQGFRLTPIYSYGYRLERVAGAETAVDA